MENNTDHQPEENPTPTPETISSPTPEATPSYDQQYARMSPEIQEISDRFVALEKEIQKGIVGNSETIELLFIALLTNGHVLLEGVPGIAKTFICKLLAKTINADFQRIQFTPDMMPSDIIGTSVFNMTNSDFQFKKGPLFSNVVLIDEINRAPAKTQSALFEAMEEKQITADGTTYKLENPFFVIATQNPIEHEGTYKLPEAQLDRFVFKINLGYPTLEQEIDILKKFRNDFDKKTADTVMPVLQPDRLIQYTKTVESIHISDELTTYIARLIDNTRNNGDLFLGASPRASLAIMKCAKAAAAIAGKNFVTPDEIRKVSYHVLGHRIILTPEREMEGKTAHEVITEIIESVEVPR